MTRQPHHAELIATIGHTVSRWQDATALFDEEVGARLGLSPSERRCLAALGQGPRPAREIADATRLTRGAVTTLLDRLEARGFVRRDRDREDRRQVLISMTPEAERLTTEHYGPIVAAGIRFLRRFAPEELATILRFVEGALRLQLMEVERLRDTPKI